MILICIDADPVLLISQEYVAEGFDVIAIQAAVIIDIDRVDILSPL